MFLRLRPTVTARRFQIDFVEASENRSEVSQSQRFGQRLSVATSTSPMPSVSLRISAGFVLNVLPSGLPPPWLGGDRRRNKRCRFWWRGTTRNARDRGTADVREKLTTTCKF